MLVSPVFGVSVCAFGLLCAADPAGGVANPVGDVVDPAGGVADPVGGVAGPPGVAGVSSVLVIMYPFTASPVIVVEYPGTFSSLTV